MSGVIRADNLTRKFGDLVAVDHLNLEIAEGEIFGLVGPDGAGKTTTLRLLCGLLDPSEGAAHVAGFDVSSNVDQVKDQIGYMAQRFGLYNDLSVDENMVFYSDLFGLPDAERVTLTKQMLQMTRMEEFRKRPAGKLSGGMKQKLALMCTLLHRPKILFLDEPTNGVDPVSRRDFWAILYNLVRDGLTLFVTTAYLDEAERCNRVGLMNKGKLIRCAAPQELKGGIQEACFRVETGNQRAAREFLGSLAQVESVEPAGAKLHVFLKDEHSTAQVQAALAARGLAAVEFERITPSLEDVFIALVRKSEAANAS